MSEDVPANTEAPPSEVREKPKRTEAQMKALELARQKANAVRSKNAEERKKAKEIERAAVEQTRRENSERIQREYDALHKQEKKEVEEEEEEIVYKKAPKKKRRVVVVQQSDSSDSEVEVKLPKPKAAPAKTAEKTEFERAYQKMFESYDY